MRKNLKLAVLCCILTCSAMSKAQTRSALTGSAKDLDTGKNLIGANIIVQSTPYGAATDLNGRYRITQLPPGQYTIEATMIGYKKVSVSVTVPAGRDITQDFELEPTVIKQQPIVVTSTRRKQNIEDAPTAVEIVTDQAIRSRADLGLENILENTTGFSVIDGQADIRGSTGFNWTAGSRVLVMLDGTPFINGDSQGISWDAIPVELVDHVEIVKGAGSALYGSNAMAGVINVITKEPSQVPRTFVKLFGGFYDKPAYDEWLWTERFFTDKFKPFEGKVFPKNALVYEGFDLAHSRQAGPVGMLFSIGRHRSSGYTENGHSWRLNGLAKLKFRLTPRMNLTAMGVYSNFDHGDIIQWKSQAEAMEVPPEELGNRVVNRKGHFQANFNHAVSSRFAYTLKANFYRSYWQNFFYDNNDYSITDRYGIEAQGDCFLGKQAITFGGEFVFYHTDATIYGGQNVYDLAFYLEDEFHFSNLFTLIAGARYDNHQVNNDRADHQFSPRLGLVVKPFEGTSIRLSGGYGFRAPSIAEVFANTNVSGFRVVPNPDLKEAERAWQAEFGVKQMFGLSHASRMAIISSEDDPLLWFIQKLDPTFIIDAAYFWSRYRNIIDVDINPDVMAFQFVTAGNAQIQGFEVSLQSTFFRGAFGVNLGYTLLDPVDLETEKTLKYRPRHRLVTGITLKLWRFSFGWDYRYASEIEEVVNVFYGDQRVPMHVMDARLIFDAGPVQAIFEIGNLRNYHYSLRQRFLEPVRQYTLTLRSIL